MHIRVHSLLMVNQSGASTSCCHLQLARKSRKGGGGKSGIDIKGNIVEEENRKTATLIYCIIVVLIFGIVLVSIHPSIHPDGRTDEE